MKLSIIVPAFNEQKLLRLTLRKIKRAAASFTALGWEHEVIVCDNNSTDQTALIAEAEGAQVVFEPINQISRARNRGAQAATGDWLLFIDADSFPSPGLFRHLAERLADERILGGGCLVKMEPRTALTGLVLGLWNLISRTLGVAAGSFIFCRADAFRTLGGFTIELFAAEELDFSRRAKALARRQKKRFVILTRHRLLTSARKLHLLKWSEHGRFFGKVLLRPGVLRDRDQCFPWYDGRR